ncbi:HD domain-containing protein [Acidaminobacter sp. JC074]|uniref:HD domain-containing phosphohydrolase n=1 Tax=Acidaminobacter sp. JC074 TaxID=2530199 RepID=UPI001F0DA077|nr:HD domain-containing phosphohydrolase [Acidaminobacter sp. JC074]MCH4890091.1 HD domain-containing protein [Acidaminobacter sp. JC074]
MKLLRKKLHSTLTYPILILILLSVFGAFYGLNSSNKRDQMKTIHNGLSVINQRITDFHEINVASLELFINDVKKAIDNQGHVDVSHVNTSINEYDSLFKFGASMALGLEDGRMFSSHVTMLPENYDPRVRPWYLDAVNNEDKVCLSAPYLTADINDRDLYVFTYSKVVKDNHDEIIGVSGLDVDLLRVFNLAKSIQITEGSFSAIASKQGKVMISDFYDSNIIQQVELDISTLDSDLPLEIHVKGRTYLVYSESNQETGWLSLIFVPKSYMNENLGNLIILSLIMILVSVMMTWLFASRFSLRISKPIEEVVSRLENIDLSESYEDFEAPSSDLVEVDILAGGINNLLHRVYEQKQTLEQNQQEIKSQYMEIEALYEETTAMNDTLHDTMDQLEASWLQTIRVLSNAIEASDHYTKGHCDRVAELAIAIGKHYGFTQNRLRNLEFAALLHDAGKVGIPDRILNKEGRLTEEEYEIVKEHPLTGYKIIRDVAYLEKSAQFILDHHERIDGKGYPNGLKGDQIDLESKILSVVDAYDAMTSARSYRKTPLSHLDALLELERHSGTQFDEKVIDVLKEVTMGN